MDLAEREIIAGVVKDFFKQESNPSICKDDENFHETQLSAEENEIRPSFYAGFLADEPSADDEDMFKNSQYPQYPLYLGVASGIITWLEIGCPFTRRISMPLLNEEVSRESRENLCGLCEPIINSIRIFLKKNEVDGEENEEIETGNNVSGVSKTKMRKLLDDETVFDVATMEFDSYKDSSRKTNAVTEDETLKTLIPSLLDVLKERGILHLLGIRDTAGSVNVLPPPSSALLESFNSLHNEKSKLTAGARALSKHFHRCQTSWWGNCKGTEAKKNLHAADVLRKIVEDCVWINIHGLPHDVNIIELRCSDGYGARWTSDGKKFRGFLEPQMEEGHSVGWRH